MHESDANGPAIWLIGDADHRDFAGAMALLQTTANIGHGNPELIVVAQNRPGTIRDRDLNRLRRSAPLAGVVSLLGSWCEGETRTGRPQANTTRLFWYEFPSWWQRQLRLRRAGLCPEWAVNPQQPRQAHYGDLEGAIVAISAANFDTAAAIGDAVQAAGGKTCWWRDDLRVDSTCPVDAGLWIGGQLNDAEAARLALFCERFGQQNPPVVALLDFPRRDRVQLAQGAGVATVLGAPWHNDALIDELRHAISVAKSNHLITRAA